MKNHQFYYIIMKLVFFLIKLKIRIKHTHTHTINDILKKKIEVFCFK